MKKTFLITALMIGFISHVMAKTKYAVISGFVSQISKDDSVTLLTNKYGFVIAEELDELIIHKAPIIDHRFRFKIPIGDNPLYIELRFKTKQKIKPLIGYRLENGDNIYIEINGGNFKFSGMGSEKFTTLYKLNHIRDIDFRGMGEDLGHPSGLANIQAKTVRTVNHQIAYLDSVSPNLNPDSYKLLKAQILGFLLSEIPTTYFHHFSPLKDSLQNVALNSVRNEMPQNNTVLLFERAFNMSPILKYSGEYSSGIILNYQMDSCYLTGKPFIFRDCYLYVKSHFNGILRDRVLTNLFFYFRADSQDMSASLTDALSFIREPDFVKILKTIQRTRLTGVKAFEFILPDTNSVNHKLSDYKGKVVLIDFWYTTCGNCIEIAPYLEKIEKKLQNRPVTFLSINLDKHKIQWINSVRSGKYSSPYVTNLNTQGLGIKHPLCLHYQVTGCPTLLLIDKNGRLMQNPLDPRKDDGKKLYAAIEDALSN